MIIALQGHMAGVVPSGLPYRYFGRRYLSGDNLRKYGACRAVALFHKACGVLARVSRVTSHRRRTHTAPRIGQDARPQSKMCQVPCFPMSCSAGSKCALPGTAAVPPAWYLQHPQYPWSDAQRQCYRYTNPGPWASSAQYLLIVPGARLRLHCSKPTFEQIYMIHHAISTRS